jgi:hypothetical protein
MTLLSSVRCQWPRPTRSTIQYIYIHIYIYVYDTTHYPLPMTCDARHVLASDGCHRCVFPNTELRMPNPSNHFNNRQPPTTHGRMVTLSHCIRIQPTKGQCAMRNVLPRFPACCQWPTVLSNTSQHNECVRLQHKRGLDEQHDGIFFPVR